MNLHRLLQQRTVAGQPVRVGLIGAGKFGSMFLSQVPTLPGLEIAVIADLNPEATGNPTARQRPGAPACRCLALCAAQDLPSLFQPPLLHRICTAETASDQPATAS